LTQLSIIGFKALTAIEPNAFQHVNHLEKLCLANNSIERIESGAFDDLNKLTRLELNGNKLTTSCLSEMPATVEYLSLASNEIDGSLVISSHNTRLKVLDLGENKLASIPKRSVSNLPLGLVNLNVRENKIVDIESGAFNDLVNLNTLTCVQTPSRSWI
jgi:Leucine-rich repeat (LRR) protein